MTSVPLQRTLPKGIQSLQNALSARVDATRGNVAPMDDPLRINHKEGPIAFTILLVKDTISGGDIPGWVVIGQKRES